MSTDNQKHGLPTIVSFIFPGLGQMIKGQIGKGIMIIIGMVISVLLIGIGIGLITTPLLWLWNVIDAYNSN